MQKQRVGVSAKGAIACQRRTTGKEEAKPDKWKKSTISTGSHFEAFNINMHAKLHTAAMTEAIKSAELLCG
jgi:hypothetical protein